MACSFLPQLYFPLNFHVPGWKVIFRINRKTSDLFNLPAIIMCRVLYEHFTCLLVITFVKIFQGTGLCTI